MHGKKFMANGLSPPGCGQLFNSISDKRPRIFHENTELSPNQNAFTEICGVFDKPDVDLLASKLSHKVNNYCVLCIYTIQRGGNIGAWDVGLVLVQPQNCLAVQISLLMTCNLLKTTRFLIFLKLPKLKHYQWPPFNPSEVGVESAHAAASPQLFILGCHLRHDRTFLTVENQAKSLSIR